MSFLKGQLQAGNLFLGRNEGGGRPIACRRARFGLVGHTIFDDPGWRPVVSGACSRSSLIRDIAVGDPGRRGVVPG